MAVERIEELLNPQAVEAFKELVKVLTEAVQKEDDLLKKSAQLSEQLQGGSVKNYNKTLQELNTTSEKITQTDSQRLNIERELKAQSDKAIQVLKTETEEQKKLQQAIEKYTVDTEELAFSYTRLSQKVESYNAKIKSAKQEQKDLGKELRNGIITQSEYDSKVEQLVATMAEAKLNVEKYKLELAKNQQAIKANIKEEIASTGSLEQKSVQLGKLRSLWGALTESEREQAKQDGVTLQAIQRLDEELKAEEGQLGLNQRRVGEYEIAGNALGGSQVSLRTQIRNIREELAKQIMVFEQSGALIQKQKMLTDQLAVSKGEESQEYKDAKIELDRLTQSQTTAQQAMQKLQTEGGKLQDIYGDASGRVKALSSDFANTDAAVQGVGLLVDGYTVFQSALVAMGIESEDLMNIFSKLMILQQGLNSVSQITKALQSESILRTKLEVIWLKLKAAATKQNAVETVKDTVAMGADTAAKGAETVATTTATAANVGLTGAIKSVGAAIKSIPVIGWILAAVAALGTLTVLLYRHLSAEKELTAEQEKRKKLDQDIVTLKGKVAESTRENEIKLRSYIGTLDKVKIGSASWLMIVKDIAETTGLDYEKLVKFPDKIKNITDAWISNARIKATADAAFQIAAEREVNTEKLLMELSTADVKRRREIVKELNISKQLQDKILRDIKDVKTTEAGTGINELHWVVYKEDVKKVKDEVSELNKQLINTVINTKTLKQQAENNELLGIFTDKSGESNSSSEVENEEAVTDRLKEIWIERAAALGTWKDNLLSIEQEYQEKLGALYAKKSSMDSRQYDLELMILKKATNDKLHEFAKVVEAQELTTEQTHELQQQDSGSFVENAENMKAGLDLSVNYMTKHTKKRINIFRKWSELTEADQEAWKISVGAITGAINDLGNAIAGGIEDEERAIKVRRNIALINIGIAQAQSIANAIASLTEAGGWAKSGIAAKIALIATIVATIAAITAQFISVKNELNSINTNVTGYAEGTGAGGHKGGLALMGEGKAKNGNGYEPELVEIGSKKMIVTSPVIADLPAGAIVTPFYKLQNEDRVLSLDETNSLLNNIYNKKQASVEVNVGRGIEYIVRRGLGKTKILNSRFKLN